MSNFLDNLMGGFAFGMLASNPFFRCMGGFGGCCSGFGIGLGFGGINSTYISGFANPFPSIFGAYGGGGYASSAGLIMPEGFANNSFPQIDFATPCQTIWDTFTNPDSDYNKGMRDWFQRMNNQSNPLSSSKNEDKTAEKDNSSDLPEADSSQKSAQKEKSKPVVSVNNQATLTDMKTKKVTNSLKYEFAEIYTSLGINDERYKKFLEESILNSEGREYIKDNNGVMTNCGVQQGTYNSYRKRKKLPKQDVKYMTNKEMCEIYYDIYKECGADKIKDERMSLYVFDVAVNSGSKIAKRFYRKSGGDAKKFEQLRKEHYTHLAKSNPKQNGDYLKGWLARLDKIRKYADENFLA